METVGASLSSININRTDKFKFKLLFDLQKGSGIDAPPSRIPLLIEEGAEIVCIIQSSNPAGLENENASNAIPYSILGGPYATRELAVRAARQAKTAILLWAVEQRIGVDFSSWARSEPDITVKANHSNNGIEVEPHDQDSLSICITIFPNKQQSSGNFVGSFGRLFGQRFTLSEKQSLALELLASSYFDSSQRSQFVGLITSIECLIDQRKLSLDGLKIIEELTGFVDEANLEMVEKESISGQLNSARRLSISKAGRNMAGDLLDERTYDGMSPAAFFKKIYDVRSQIVHSGLPQLDSPSFSKLLTTAQAFVGDLILKSISNENIPNVTAKVPCD